MKVITRFVLMTLAIVPSLLLGSVPENELPPTRDINSTVKLPGAKSVFETDDILSSYQGYLQFVTTIGRRADSKNTQRLVKVYDVLRRKSPDQAAQFLKGLRFELISKVDLMGVDPNAVYSNNPELHRWVGRYMREWVREADEHLFRALTNHQIAKAE